MATIIEVKTTNDDDLDMDDLLGILITTTPDSGLNDDEHPEELATTLPGAEKPWR